jgi:hypothetical protein
MRTLQEKYNGIQEGKFSKENFLADARKELPNLVTRFNGYDDAVQILKNRGMIQEARVDETTIKMVPGRVYASKHGKLTYIGVIPPGGSHKGQKNPTQENLYLFADESGKKGFGFTIEQLKQARMDPMSTAGDFGNLPKGNIVTVDGTQGLLDIIANATVNRTVSGPELNEAKQPKPTKKGLADYRYKPTNEMDKYPYEQILRGLRVELETMGVQGTPTAEEYAKALAKVSKNLAKDPIFYTNQIAGVNPNVDLHDQMVDATSKNTVDTFNGMKKAELKEGFKKLIKKVLAETVIDVEDYNGEDGIYEMQGPKSDAEYKRELENYLEDNQIYGYTDMLFDILTAPNEEAVVDNLADFLDDHQIYGYNKGLLRIFRDYANRDQSHDEWDDTDYEKMSNSISEEDDLDENKYAEVDAETDRKFIIKLMGMYEYDPSKYENLEKEAEMLASTESDPKYKHVFGLIKKAKEKALESLANQDRFEADREGMDEDLYEGNKPLSELLK